MKGLYLYRWQDNINANMEQQQQQLRCWSARPCCSRQQVMIMRANAEQHDLEDKP
jgi:hypothetical protein